MCRLPADFAEPSRSLQETSCSTPDDATAMDLDLAMPPSDDDVLESDTRIYTPPPRVAARFYRPSQARRRDSAASSRRNSISSAHSRCSSLQQHAPAPPACNDDGQSKYVAQHLRRASFLEDRRARLADRAAHAEKVRLRAALAKAAPRGPTASEERALAAQQARERNLAEIVANCAEEVRKAKQVAELTKERRELEIAKMRAQIEERMADAERRREELLTKSVTKRPRGQSVLARRSNEETLAQVKEYTKPSLSEDDAAACIQAWWRGRTRKSIIQEFNSLGLSVDGIRDASFDTVVELLAQEKVLLVTSRLLRICGLQEGAPGSVDEMAAVRTFLSAFLILGHPNQVLSNKNEAGDESEPNVLASHRLPSADLANPQLRDLVGKAKDLLVNFENILVRLTACNRYTMPPALKSSLPEAYAVFYNTFIAWKSRDSNALIEVMLMQFVELDAIFQTVKDTTDDAAASLYRQSIQDSQLMLIVRIKKLAGADKGKRLIFKAVSEARKSRKAKKQTGDTKPRVAEGSAGDVTATASSLVSSESQTLTPPATPSGRVEGRPVVVKTGLNGLLPDNRIVVHELAINKEYQIPSEEYVEQQAVLARPLYMQMRVAMAENDTEANFGYFILMAGNIKEKLQRLLKPGNSLYNLTGEILDPELAERQFIVGNFSYERFFTAMGSLLPKLCAPFRDDEVKDLVQNRLSDGDLIDRVEALNRFIDVMLCDYINYLLRIAAPQLIESAAQYEAKRFSADVVEGGMSLSIAEAAWRSAATKVVNEAQRRDPEGVNHPKSQPSAARFYAQMLVDVFTQPTPVRMEQIPEMLQLDHQRINEVSCTIQRIITAGAVLLQCKNLLKRDVRSAWKTEATRIMAVLEANHPSLDATVQVTMAAVEAGRSVPAVTKTHLRALVTKVLKASQEMSQQRTEPRERVLQLLLTRLRGNILARLAPGSASEKVKAANTAGERLASLGLSEFVEQVRGISDLLDKVGSVDRAAHSLWWDAVATKVQQEDAA
ncbi:IQ calmodulin-binding motif domain protein [Metarhizium album ARSEF 1941]|uniref:IQ calmodulin-binding motif domain protein n=1 Tax=Metarhizium album (strain ARSEF 1941) TaxID=1081103 RepID=A0A0B2WMU2_METAS|nr:IQ calmodulin-binding motif domain protein [Metarhizium album ARSEF 1941]KHN94797.1 IQ calmodulin-binding motif domain protein [Metarhizium album ARSEF 1941]